MLHVSYVVVILAYFLREILQMQTKLKSFHHILVISLIPKAFANEGGDFKEKKYFEGYF